MFYHLSADATLTIGILQSFGLPLKGKTLQTQIGTTDDTLTVSGAN